jgi:EAL domain-containing protein (putative c-di-GMP-specific phosphodiesterase class I)
MECGIDCIELSRKLIAEIENKADIRRLVESITKYAINMGLSVAAVGIENQQQYDILKAMGVTKMQGYLICKPVSHDQFEDVLNQGKFIIS